MICPEHPGEECRPEHDSEMGYTGFCPKCCRHHPQCEEVHYMDMCDLPRGHDGPHSGRHGARWTVNPDGSYNSLHIRIR